VSGFDPLAALAADASLQASALATIDLGVAIEILQAQLNVGDLLTATILPPQGGADRLAVLGQTVLAQLPPGIDPGESLLLQVTGFTGNQIVVRNLGVVDPQNPPPTASVTLPAQAPGEPTTATLTTVVSRPPDAAPSSAPAATPAASSQGTSPPAPSAGVAPPPAVFVAASVRQVPAGAPAAAASAAVSQELDQLGLEARIAASRAASVDLSELVNTPAKAAPPIPAPAAAAARPPAILSAPPAPQAPPAPPSGIPAKAAPPSSPEAALLAKLGVQTTPLTLAAARLASQAASALPKALARLDSALAGVAAQDTRAGSLRAIAAFVARLDPSNARALPEQLAAFVSNVFEGAEAKVAAVLRQMLDFAAPEQPEDSPAPAAVPQPEEPTGAAQPLPPAPAASQTAPPPADAPPAPPQSAASLAAALPPSAAARVVERLTALQYDLKSSIVAMLESPPRGAPADLLPALNDALTTITALQLNALGAQNADPNAIVIPLPVFYRDGGRPVQLRVSKDAPGGGKIDPDNFHIAFVLDTKTLGTVAVDVQTVGRAVSVNVKTEAAPAAGRFRTTLDDLRSRLEHLRYRVAAMAASVAPHRFGNAAEAQPAPAESDSSRVVDMRA